LKANPCHAAIRNRICRDAADMDLQCHLENPLLFGFIVDAGEVFIAYQHAYFQHAG
jgi:hypothetical protein